MKGSSLKIYLASRYSRREELCGYREQLRSRGHEVPAVWLNGGHQIGDCGKPIGSAGESLVEGDNGSQTSQAIQLRQKFAQDDLTDVADCDCLIAFTEPSRTGPTRGGRHVELGLALGMKKRVIVCGPRENIFCWLPGVEHADDFAGVLRLLHPEIRVADATKRIRPRILFVGHGRCGKDTGLELLSAITGLKNAGCLSKYLAEHVANRLGTTWQDAYRLRHENRELWFKIGNELRANDPAILLREAFQYGDMTGGLRAREEIQFVKQYRMVDLIIWVENKRVPVDPTLKFGPEECDVVIENNGTVDEYAERLKRLATFAGLC